MKVGKSLKHMTEAFTRGYRVMERTLLLLESSWWRL